MTEQEIKERIKEITTWGWHSSTYISKMKYGLHGGFYKSMVKDVWDEDKPDLLKNHPEEIEQNKILEGFKKESEEASKLAYELAQEDWKFLNENGVFRVGTTYEDRATGQGESGGSGVIYHLDYKGDRLCSFVDPESVDDMANPNYLLRAARKNLTEAKEKNEKRIKELMKYDVVIKYNAAQRELLELKNGKQNIATKAKIKRLENQVDSLFKYYPVVREFYYLKNVDYSKKDKIVKELLEFEKHCKASDDQFARKSENIDMFLGYLNHQAGERIKREERVMDFMLIKLYKENEADFETSEKPLITIFNETMTNDEFEKHEFLNNIGLISKAYDKAVEIVGKKGEKFTDLPEQEQLKYFEVSYKQLQAKKDFGLDM